MGERIYNSALEAAKPTSTVFTDYVSNMKSNIVKYSIVKRSDFSSILFQNKLKLLKLELVSITAMVSYLDEWWKDTYKSHLKSLKPKPFSYSYKLKLCEISTV